ncbi:unnamed protein product, partial [Brassica rapa]
VGVSVCPSVSVSTHRTSVVVHQYTYQHVGPWTQHAGPSHGLFGTLVLGLSTLALPVDCSGDFGPLGLPVQYTQDVRGCPPAHTGRLWLSMCVRVCPSAHTRRILSVGVRVCPYVSVSTHRTSVAVHQYTYQHVGPWTQHAGTSRGLFGTHSTSVGVRQHTQDVCGCPPAHTGRLWLSVSTHRTSMAVRVCLWVTHRTSVCVRQHTHDVHVCPCVSVSAHRTSVCVRQHTHDVRVLHTGRPCVSASTHRTSVDVCGCPTSVAVRVYPCVSVCVRQHTQDVRGCPSVHISARWSYTQDVRGCPPEHTGRSWLLSVGVRICPSVSVSTHRTSVAVHQYTYQHVGPWTQHAGPSHGLFGAQDVHGCPCVSVGVRRHTQDICGCPWLSVSTHRTSVCDVCGCPCVSVCVRQHTQDVRRLWLSISTHISTLVLGLCTLTLPVDCSGDFGPRGLFFSVHTGRPWVSARTERTSVAVRHTQDVRGCPCVSISTHRTYVAVHQYTYQHAGPWTQHAGPSPRWPFPWTVWVILAHVGCLFSTHRTSVGVRQHTQDGRGCPWCPSAHTGHPWLSVCVLVCP